MDVEQVIVEILKAVGVYEKARKIIGSDEELARMFNEEFEQLILKVGG